MNFKRGFRRIVFVLSLFASLAAAILCFYDVFDTWDSEKVAYSDSKNDYEQIAYFWRIWDSDGWVDGKHEIVKTLVNQNEFSFEFGDNKIATVSSWDIFPGIYKDMLSMPLTTLDKEAKTAKERAIDKAEQRIKSHEYWGTKNVNEAIFIGIAAALGGAGLGFLVPWIIGVAVYIFSKWLILGFHDDICDQIEKAKPSH